jgi:hypothetical protein
MNRKVTTSILRLLAIVGMALLPAIAVAQVPCSGHKLLPTPRPESSCTNVKPKIYRRQTGRSVPWCIPSISASMPRPTWKAAS